MHIDPRYVGHVFLQFGRRSFYLAPPQGESPDLQWLAAVEVLIITASFPNGIRYQTRNLRITNAGQATCNLVPADRWQENMEKRWLGPKRDAVVTKVTLRSPDGETTLDRGPRGLYRVAA
ncbi:MAG: hypothetical protein AAB974_02365 [Patescibacteria group bacterium]